MDIKSLQEWLRHSRQAGLTDGQIRDQLKSTGWTDQQVTDLFSGDMFRQGQLENVGATTKDDFDTMSGLDEKQTGTGGELPGVLELAGQAWDLFISKISKLLAISIITGILGGIIVGIIVLAGGFGTIFTLNSNGSSITSNGFITYLFILAGAWLVISVVFSWMQAAILITLAEDTLSLGAILGRAIKMLFSYWWITILMSFLIGGASLLFSIPGMIFSIWFSFAIMVLVTENIHGMQALLKSKEYVRGYWLAVFGRNLAFGFLITIPLTLVFTGLAFARQATIIAILQGLISILLLPYMLCFSYMIFFHLRRIKGTGMPVPDKKIGIIITALVGWIILILILFSIGGSAFIGFQSKAADATRKSDISHIYTAAILYYDDNRSYPATLTELTPNYITNMPMDPKSKMPYEYTLDIGGNDFKVCATLDSTDFYSNSKNYCLGTNYNIYGEQTGT